MDDAVLVCDKNEYSIFNEKVYVYRITRSSINDTIEKLKMIFGFNEFEEVKNDDNLIFLNKGDQ
ncbi:MAG: hypothetical protein GX166_01810 [Clostridiaceae bacterium]|nr:hypothetical protein [Clostridiaceae bacterium]